MNRLGNKRRVADDIISHFPSSFDTYFEPFFGGGGMFFSLIKHRKPNYIYLNDLDNDVANFYFIMQNETQKNELIKYIENVPYHKEVFNTLRKKTPENVIEKVGIFLIKTYWSYLGKGETLHFVSSNKKLYTLQIIESEYKILTALNVKFNNVDFEKFFKQYAIRNTERSYDTIFSYNDPPYLETENNYNTPVWTSNDFERLILSNKAHGGKFAISEFAHPEVLRIAEKHSLNIVQIGERQNIKNRRSEILLTNYFEQKTLF